MLTYAHVCSRMVRGNGTVTVTAREVRMRMLTYADLCWRMLTYADVCWRMLTYADVMVRGDGTVTVTARELPQADWDLYAAVC
jgi:hypothetical protein